MFIWTADSKLRCRDCGMVLSCEVKRDPQEP